MAERSISDEEIALIKAMLGRGMKNGDIQFFFNQPDRKVNTGRITGMANGKYSNSVTIPAANDERLDAFISTFQPSGVSSAVAIATPQAIEHGPMRDVILQAMFQKGSFGKWRFRLGETDRHECKESFGFKHADKWMRAVAALANNFGGYVLFGVRDMTLKAGVVDPSSHEVCGLSSTEFESADPAEFSKKLKSFFDPTPRVETKCLILGAVKVGIMHVYPHPTRDVT